MKLKYKIVSFVLIFSFAFSVLGFRGSISNFTALALSNATIELSDYRPDVGNVTYTISFTTSNSAKLVGGDSISLHFVKKSGDNWIDNSQTVADVNDPSVIRINNYPCERVAFSDVNSGYIQVDVPDNNAFADGVGRITVTILPQSGFMNPDPGTYAVYVSTSKETAPILTNSYVIGAPKLSNVSVSVSPSLVNANADYEVTFKTSNYGSLSAGSDRIRVVFPSGTDIPSEIPANSISVKANGISKKVETSLVPSNNNVVFTVPQGLSIGKNDTVQVSFTKSCGIKNPPDSGEYTLTVDTEEYDGTYIDSPTESAKYKISASSVSNVSVTVKPNQVNASPEITVSFKTSSVGLLTANSGLIYVKFPDEEPTFYVPQIIGNNSVLVNGKVASKVEVSGYLVQITVPQSIAESSIVTVKFKNTSGIKNPNSPGTYNLKVWTSADPEVVTTPDISISASTVGKANVVVTPSITGMNASYIITFTTGSSGALQVGDKIYITFPSGTYLPPAIPPNTIQVNGAAVSSAVTNIASRKLIIAVPTLIGSNSTVAIIIDKAAGIKNPPIKGQYTLKVHTDKETVDIASNPYMINKGVSTSLSVNPSSPDGKNGYYKTVPTIKIVVDNPSHLSYTIYYKWDDGEFTTYNGGALKGPEGIHTLYYYSQDQFQHKEQVHKRVFKVDSVKPKLKIVSPADNSVVNNPNITINGETEPGVTLKVKVGGNIQPISINSDGKFQFVYTFSTNGTYVFQFFAEDEAGNISSTTISIRFVLQKRIMLKVNALTAYVNDEKIMLDAAPIIYKNRVMVPIRFISQSLGATVNWDPIFKIVTITMPDGKRVRLQVGNSTAAVGKMNATGGFDEVAVKLDVPPIIVKNRTFVPIRFIAEAFGAEVDWDPEFRVVRIIYPKPKQP